MLDHNLARAQASYDAQEPKEPSGRCECGHDYDEHVEATDSPKREALAELLDSLHGRGNEVPAIRAAKHKARLTLASCQQKDCYCRRFEPATEDPNLSQEEE